jgi:hypothetical protein
VLFEDVENCSSSSGYGRGCAELDAPGGSGKLIFEAAAEEDADGGAGYLKRDEARSVAGLGLAGL